MITVYFCLKLVSSGKFSGGTPVDSFTWPMYLYLPGQYWCHFLPSLFIPPSLLGGRRSLSKANDKNINNRRMLYFSALRIDNC